MVYIDATIDLYEYFELRGMQKAVGEWILGYSSIGDESNIDFTIIDGGGSGQIQYTSGNEAGYSSSTMKFRATTINV